MVRAAVVQKPPCFFDKARTLELAVHELECAAANGAELVVFGEAFIPGYPVWIWRLRPGSDGDACEALHRHLLRNAVNLDRDFDGLCKAASRCGVTVVCGMNEIDAGFSHGTMYNTVVVIGADGRIANRHRKLVPTNPERMVWGRGDGSGLNVTRTAAGNIGTLICWENYMPLARYALYAQGVEIYIAPTYDSGEAWLGTLQHIAREGRCWVVGCGSIVHARHLAVDPPQLSRLYPDPKEWVNPGGSVVIEPGGRIVAGPLARREGVLVCDIDPGLAQVAKRALDVAGHYARPDVFDLRLNKAPQLPVSVSGNAGPTERSP